MSEFTSLLAGVAAGLSIAAPFGPTSMMCIERTLTDGVRAGISTGFGVATVHLTYCSAALVGGMSLLNRPEALCLLSFGAGALLLYFAARLWRRELAPVTAGRLPSNFRRDYCGAICFGFLNPVTPALCAAAMTAISGGVASSSGILPLGVFMGSFAWWVIVSLGFSKLRLKLTLGNLTLANRAAAVLLAVLALSMLAKGLAA